MSKTALAGFKTHMALETTTLTTCIYLRRRDGTEFRFTEFDSPIVLSVPTLDARGRDMVGTYEITQGESPSNISSSAALNVDNLEILTVLSSPGITEVDLHVGLWDYADFNIFQVVHSDLTLGVMWLMSGKLGEVSMTRGADTGTVELRSKSSLLSETIGTLVTHECSTDFGSLKCGVLGAPANWLLSTAYTIGDRISPSVYERIHFVCTVAGTSGGSEPVWNLPLGDSTTDNSATWEAYSVLKPSEWAVSRVYALNDVVSPSVYDKRRYVCTTAGTSGGSEPTWNTTIDATTADNSVVWTAQLATLWEGEVDSVVDRSSFADSLLTDAAIVDGWFQYGLLTWTSGLNAGLESEIKTYTQSTGALVLWRAMPFTVANTDQFIVESGCDKARATCRDKFANIVNFRGFPWVPGRDVLYQTGATQ